jgi:hypothetical protein
MSMKDELEAQGRRAYAQRSSQERKVRSAAVTEVADQQGASRPCSRSHSAAAREALTRFGCRDDVEAQED